MTEEQRNKLHRDVALKVFNAEIVQLQKETCYKINGERWNSSVWLPNTDEFVFRMVKDRLVELGFEYSEVCISSAYPKLHFIAGMNFCHHAIRDKISAGKYQSDKGCESYTIQELGCIAALEAVEKLNGKYD